MTEERRAFAFASKSKEKKNEALNKAVLRTALETVSQLKYLNTRWQFDTEKYCFLQAL